METRSLYLPMHITATGSLCIVKTASMQRFQWRVPRALGYKWKTETEFVSSVIFESFAESCWNKVNLIANAEKPLGNHIVNLHEYLMISCTDSHDIHRSDIFFWIIMSSNWMMVLNHSCGDRVRGIKLLRYILERFFHNVT